MRAPIRLGVLILVSSGLPGARADVLLVSGFNSNNVVEFDATTGASLGVLVNAGSGGLKQAEQLAIAPDGSLLVDSFGSSSVLRYDSKTGAFLSVFASINSPTGLLIHDGSAYVSSFSANGFVNRYDATTGAFLGTFVTPGEGGLGAAHGMTFGPDGNLYVADNPNNRILEYNGTTGAFTRVFASGGGLSSPTGLIFGPDGNLFVSSNATGSVLQFNGSTGAFIDAFIDSGSGGLSDPHGLEFRDDGMIYVSGGNGVQRYGANSGNFVDLFAASGQLERPTYFLFEAQSVPEPSSFILIGTGGLLGAASMLRRRRLRQGNIPRARGDLGCQG